LLDERSRRKAAAGEFGYMRGLVEGVGDCVVEAEGGTPARRSPVRGPDASAGGLEEAWR